MFLPVFPAYWLVRHVGADVHAIGHPTGEAWTYTTGIVSQIRPDYEWRSGPQDVQQII
jgi:S1-C subfamily serine protease